MNNIIDLFPGYDLTNLTSLSIEICVGIIIGLLIFGLDRRNTRKQDEIISKIAKYTDTQERGLRINKIDMLSKINLKLITILTDYNRAINNTPFDNLSADEQLLRKNAILNNDKNKQLVTEIREDALKVSHLIESRLGGAILAFTNFFQILMLTKNPEDELYLKQSTNISAEFLIQLAEGLRPKINEYLDGITKNPT
jgi:hypothetical protein